MVGSLILCAALITACGGGTGSTAAVSAAVSDTADASTLTATATTPTTTTTASAVWTECAQEDEVCSFGGTRKVKYGVEAASVVLALTGEVTCDNATFGDPAVGQWKKCWYDAAATIAANTTTAPVPAVTTAAAPTTTSTTATTTAAAPAGATSTTFTGSTTDFLNPERGFYATAKDSEMTAATLGRFSTYWHVSTFLYIIDMSPYRSSALPQSFLDALNARFAAGRAAGVKFIVQPEYNSDTSGADAPISLALQHIAQLKPIYAQNADVIPFMKAGIIGAYGEWWGSTNGLDSTENKLAIKNAILSNTPASMIVHFRHPDDIAAWYPNNPAAAAAARVGLHNDCYMANDTDAYTYPGGLNDPLRAYVKKMAENSGFGGETCDNVTNSQQMRLTCAQAISEHAAHHMSWLNAGYAPVFIDSWKSGGCFDQISRSMGYRLQLDGVNHAPSASKGTTVAVNVTLRNTGWARMFSKRALVVTLRNKSTGATITGSGGDLTAVASGAAAQMTVNVSLPAGTAAGTYDVLISAPDIWSTIASDARFAVRFANADSGSQAWDATNARFSTGTSIAIQ